MAGVTVFTSESTGRRFRRLVRQWYQGVGDSSILMDKLNHPAYQHIIDLGDAAVGLILQELGHDEGHWFHALEEITGEDPVPEDADLDASVEAWLEWGKRNGKI